MPIAIYSVCKRGERVGDAAASENNSITFRLQSDEFDCPESGLQTVSGHFEVLQHFEKVWAAGKEIFWPCFAGLTQSKV